MKKNMADLMKLGIVVPALVLSLAACGGSQASDAGKSAEAPAAEAKAAEAEETKAEEETKAAEAPAAAEEEAPGVETVYENGGLQITVPAEFANKVIVKAPVNSEDGVIFDVSEKASVEAGKAKGAEYDGMGWLFAICKRDEEMFHKMLCSDMSGEEPIGYDADGNYYVFYHPTDVRYDRETPEQMQADQDEWTAVVEWSGTMKKAFLDENKGITPFNWSSTVLESYLARTAFDSEAVYTLSTTQYGPLEPGNVDAKKYFEQMTSDAAYEIVDEEAPDGEYVVLNFPEDDVRFDFFSAEGGQNLIRQVWGDNEQMYKVTFADESKTAHSIMQAWYDEIAANR